MVWDVASTAPAFGVKSRSAMARSIRRRVSPRSTACPRVRTRRCCEPHPHVWLRPRWAIVADPFIVEAVRCQLLAQPLPVVKGWSECAAVVLHSWQPQCLGRRRPAGSGTGGRFAPQRCRRRGETRLGCGRRLQHASVRDSPSACWVSQHSREARGRLPAGCGCRIALVPQHGRFEAACRDDRGLEAEPKLDAGQVSDLAKVADEH